VLRLDGGFVRRHRFVFVGGLHRSGTSMLSRALASHAAVSGLSGSRVPEDEGQHLQDVLPSALTIGGPGRFGFSPAAHLTEESPLSTPGNRDRLLASWLPYWDSSRPVLLEKSPPNLLRTRLLQALFPPAHFVLIIRHPIAVAEATLKWSNSSLASLVQHWAHCHRLLLEDAPTLRKVVLVRYEDLVERPAEVLGRVLEFLGLEGPLSIGGLRPDVNEAYFKRWETRPQALAELAETGIERLAQAFGYGITTPQRREAVSRKVSRHFVTC